MNLMYLAQTGLVSAQSSLHVVGNNLSNAMTMGYSRQSVILGEAGGRTTGNGFFGYGSQVNGVQRAYDSFINNQVRSAASEYTAMNSRYEQLSQIDNMLGDDKANISVSLGNMFVAMEEIDHDPASNSGRQATLSSMRAISSQFQTNSKTLAGLEKSTNTQINQSVNEINACAEQLAKLNQEIAKIHGQSGTLPADLMDQRDVLLDKLSQQVGIKVTENPVSGRVDVTMGNGLPLVNGDRAYALDTSPSPSDPSQIVVSYIDASGNSMQIDESKFTTGTLGGLFKFRSEDLVDARNQLNELALQMANRFNEVNREGYDAFGNRGGNLFNIADPVALANRNNVGSGSLEVSYNNISQVTARDYNITYTDTGWQVTTLGGDPVTTEIGPNGELQFDGMSIIPQGLPQPGDSFQLNSVSGIADKLSVAISDGNQIAASSSPDAEEQSNNENIKAMIAIKNETLIGKSTLDEAYSRLVSSVGSSMTSLKASASTSIKAYDAVLYQKQAISGVDLNEEFVNLQMFSQYYQANAQVLQAATTLFDTILSIR